MRGEKGREEGREWKEWEEVGMGKGGRLAGVPHPERTSIKVFTSQSRI